MGFAAVFRPGSIVRGRGRLWRVLELADPFLRAESLDGLARATFYLPREGDGLRLEAAPHPPARPGPDPALHRLYLETEHLRTLQADAPFLALQRSRVVPHSFQLVPLLMALENPERVRLLIADDVGLGKTIEAGMVGLELIIRHRARKILIVVPSSLQIQWR
ncbi:MAG TPA: DNA/RNA helicase, superfamily II, SNF2 family protein, partial [Oceanithermus sp.]|nr:DNA/RNA helicase, superfamily II, SNF2 family protein [Oceanithermus sp.]